MVGLEELSNLDISSLAGLQTIANYLGISLQAVIVLVTIISIWTLVWKDFALWKASKKNHLIWFIVLLIINTIGILEILYIFVFSKISLKKGKIEQKQKVKKK